MQSYPKARMVPRPAKLMISSQLFYGKPTNTANIHVYIHSLLALTIQNTCIHLLLAPSSSSLILQAKQTSSSIYTAMPSSPPLAPKPRALPSYLMNGHSSPLQNPLSLRDSSERENLYASIKSSNGPWRQPINFTTPGMSQNATSTKPPTRGQDKGSMEQEHARDPRDEAPDTPPQSASRSVSPFTAVPTVDFDGLSWPSE